MSDIRETLMTAIGQKQARKQRILFFRQQIWISGAGCILLVEDNELNREIAVEPLMNMDFVLIRQKMEQRPWRR